MTELKVLTFSGTSFNQRLDMTIDIPEGATIILKNARVEVSYVGDAYPKHCNIAIGNTISTNYVIDADVGQNFFKLAFEYNPQTIGGTKYNISTTYPDTGYKVSGRIEKNVVVTFYDENFAILSNLTYYFLQFSVIS